MMTHSVKLWDTMTGRQLVVLEGHTAKANGVAFSRDGRKLASASLDQTVPAFGTPRRASRS